MVVGFTLLYIELVALVVTGGYAISSLFVPVVIPDSLSSEQALLITMQ
jgi:hypothetical protein